MTWLLTLAGTVLSLWLGFWTNDTYYQGVCHGAAIVGAVWLGVFLVNRIQFQAWQLLIAAGGVFLVWYSSPQPRLLDSHAPSVRKPFRPFRAGDTIEAFHEDPTGISPDGREVTCDLPREYRRKNVGGRDGAGLCVFTSIEHAAHWQQEERLRDFQKQMTREPGGGYPEKVDAMIAKYGKGAEYVQHTGGDEDFLELALRTGRMPGVTYAGRDSRYNGPIAHMVNLVYMDDQAACILDNNFVEKYLWMTRKEFLERWRDRGGGWAVVLLAPPPPAPPHN